MKKLLFCIAVVLAFGITAAAQDTSGAQSATDTGKQAKSSTTKPDKTSTSTKSSTTTGCIEKSGDSYVLKNGRYRSGVKVTGSEDFGPHVGHTVKLTGAWTTPGQEFAATKLDMVSDTCNMGGAKKGASSTPTSTPPPPHR